VIKTNIIITDEQAWYNADARTIDNCESYLRSAVRICATIIFRLHFNASSIPYYSSFSLAAAALSRQSPNGARSPLIGSSRSALWLIMVKRVRLR